MTQRTLQILVCSGLSTFSASSIAVAAPPLLRLDGRSDRDRTQGYARDARHASKAHEQRARQLLARRR